MRIGIDLQVLANRRTGIGNYAYFLTKYLREAQSGHEFVFFDSSSGKIPFWSRHIAFARQIQKAKLDVFHGPANVLPWGLKGSNGGKARLARRASESRRGGKTVITLHDLAIYKHPEWFARGQWLATKLIVPHSIKKADKIIVPSEVTKRDLQEIFKVPEEKIAVVPHGVEDRFFRESVSTKSEAPNPKQIPNSKFQIQNKYILFVGTLEPRKNVSRLVKAYESLPSDLLEKYDLVLAGGKSDLSPPLSLLRRGRVRFLDYVADEDLPNLYQNAALFVYPSLYEGFGLPVLEAMAAGTPTIVSDTIVGNFQIPMTNDQPFLTVNPYSVESIKGAMESVLRDQDLMACPPSLRSGVSGRGGRGKMLASEFTWEKTARQTLEVYEKV